MMLRRGPGWWPALAALAVCAWMACKDDEAPSAADLALRCERLGKSCGDNPKRVLQITDDCKLAAANQVAKGCTAKAIAAYDCYAEALCGGDDKVWAVDDLRVLSERHGKCVAERTAVLECVGAAGGN